MVGERGEHGGAGEHEELRVADGAHIGGAAVEAAAEVQNTDLAEEVARVHAREHEAGGADHLEQAVRDDVHLARDLAIAADIVLRREDVRAHGEHEVVQELRRALLEDGHLAERIEVHVQSELRLELRGQALERLVDVAAALHLATRPRVVVPALHAPLHRLRHRVRAHVALGVVEHALEALACLVAVGDHRAELTDDRREDKDTDQVGEDGEQVPIRVHAHVQLL